RGVLARDEGDLDARVVRLVLVDEGVAVGLQAEVAPEGDLELDVAVGGGGRGLGLVVRGCCVGRGRRRRTGGAGTEHERRCCTEGGDADRPVTRPLHCLSPLVAWIRSHFGTLSQHSAVLTGVGALAVTIW